MVTPIDAESGSVAEDVLRSYTDFLVDGGVHGLFPCGTTGEFPSLDRHQRRTVIETVVDAADVPVLAGCGDTNVGRVHTHIEDAVAAGADAAVVVTPYYLETNQESLATFYEEIADASALPVVLYDIPGLTGQKLEIDTVANLGRHDNVVGLKTSIADSLEFYELTERMPEEFSVLPGFPELTLHALDSGGDGVICGPANVFPAEAAQVYEASTEGSHDRAVTLMKEVVFPVLSSIRSMPTVPALKYLLELRGFEVGPPLSPMPRLDDDQRETLEACYQSVRNATEVEVDS